MQQSNAAPAQTRENKQLFINTAYLGLAELLVVPVTVAINALMGRYLGPVDLGYIYVATNLSKFAFIAVEWGQPQAVPAMVAADRTNAGSVLSTSIAWRVALAALMMACLIPVANLLGYGEDQKWALVLVGLHMLVTTLTNSYMEIILGHERMDLAGASRVGSQLALLVVVLPALLLGGGLKTTLILTVLVQVALLVVLVLVARQFPLGKPSVTWASLKQLLQRGTPFVIFTVVLVLQPSIDAIYLEKYAPPDIVGCFAVAQRLVGFLLLPVTSLIGAMYPALFRLRASNEQGFLDTVETMLGSVPLIVAPAAIGCALYARLGVSIYGGAAYEDAIPVLQAFAPFLILVYWTMALSAALVAAGRQRAWTIVQLTCVANSVVLDPILVPYFQEHYGNGGLGVALTVTISELLMLASAVFLLPRGMITRQVGRRLMQGAAAGLAMGAAGYALSPISDFVGAPVSVVVYVAALYALGAVTREQLGSIFDTISRKIGRRVRPA
jgi:polysaccharide transporter, PST family